MWDDIALMPERASTIAGELDMLFLFVNLVAVFFTVLVSVLIVYFAIRYRHREGHTSTAVPSYTWLEILWSVIPLAIALTIFVWGAVVFVHVRTPPKDALDIFVTGKQWMWKIQHPTGPREINTLHVPVGQPVRLTMASEDVLHSFFVPAFRVKQDVVPGKYTTLWFEATKTGTFRLFCTEYCGTSHSEMIGNVIVMEADEYQRWAAGESLQAETTLEAGERLFAESCVTCHKDEGTARGPSLRGLFGTKVTLADGSRVLFDEEYTRSSIFTPARQVVANYKPIMPSFQGQLSEEQVLQLIAYIRSLSVAQAGSEPVAAAVPDAAAASEASVSAEVPSAPDAVPAADAAGTAQPGAVAPEGETTDDR